jgi:broad specificity phosphatase PhoE
MPMATVGLLLLHAARVGALQYLILRHGETNHNAEGIIQGSSDVSRLSDKGVEQARYAGAALAEQIEDGSLPPIRRVLCSPLTRAQQTLELLRESVPSLPEAIDVHDLREIDLHSWEGRTKAELQAAFPQAYEAWKGSPILFDVGKYSPVIELWGRATRAWRDEIRKDEFTPYNERMTEHRELEESDGILLVCHNAVGQALLSTAFGGDCTDFRKREFSNCGLAEIDWPSDAARATQWRMRTPEGKYEVGEWHGA